MSTQPQVPQEIYIGVNGEQRGPLSVEVVRKQFASGQIPQNALIWFDGLPDWIPVTDAGFLQKGFADIEKPAAAPAVNPSTVVISSSAKTGDTGYTFAKRGAPPDLVFKKGEGLFGEGKHISSRFKMFGYSLAGLVTCAVLATIFLAGNDPKPEAEKAGDLAKQQQKMPRDALYRLSVSQLTVKSKESLENLIKLVKQNSEDEIGKKALEQILDFNKRNRRFADSGQLLFELGRFEDAANSYLQDPPNYAKAQESLERAASVAKEPAAKQDLMLKGISLLFGPLNDKVKGIAQLAQLQKEFPTAKHNFQYYLLTPREKVQKLFSKVSEQYLKNFEAHFATEFPDIRLSKRAQVKLLDEKQGYRIEVRYEGPMSLGRDTLLGMRLRYWKIGGEWVLVETNLTEQRALSSTQSRKKHSHEVFSPEDLSNEFETIFTTLYPKQALE